MAGGAAGSAETVVGFDFGTTNSLMSVVVGDGVIDVMGDDGRPFPSVVRYEGARTIVGREARDSLDTAGIGVHGSTVLSPKFLLGEETVHVGGVDRSPVDIVRDVVAHVRDASLTGRNRNALDGASRAVVTIPVTMDGPRRAALRDAFLRAGVGIVQFVHEPLAALYGWFREHDDPADALRTYDRRNVLVVDWGGGTLDLTLCRLDGGQVVQLRNGGSAECGGDRFDEAIRDGVVARFCEDNGITCRRNAHLDARLRLLHDAENAKIDLSERTSVTLYRPGFFTDPAVDLRFRLTRDDLEDMTRPMVRHGIDHVTSLLESVSMGPAQVAMVIVTGGMAAMPAISGRLFELFGAQRVVVPGHAGTLISRGAAWIAHDRQRLRLAKPLEVRMARGSYLPVVAAGTEMPDEGDHKRRRFQLYCADPRDGHAKIEFCTPTRPIRHPQRSDPREDLAHFVIDVDATAQPFRERIDLDITIDDNLVLRAQAFAAESRSTGASELHDLEFALAMPAPEPMPSSANGSDHRPPADVTGSSGGHLPRGGVVTRANVADTVDDELVPGELLYTYKHYNFRRGGEATQIQQEERLYYEPCAVCKRSWSNPNCRCLSGRSKPS